jgi:L-malate glycosyltransferase
MKILHIASHYGGGIGSVVNSWVRNDNENTHALTYLNPDPLNDKPGRSLLDTSIIPGYDIVIVHVWNHPALWDFLVNTEIPPCRMIGWMHMLGLKPPYIVFDELVNYFDDFYFTSPISRKSGINRKYIHSCCDIKEFSAISPAKHKEFTIGYVGTVDFAKLHPDFIKLCKQIKRGKFVVIGGGSDLEAVKEQAKKAKIIDRFTFTGFIEYVKPYLSKMDVFMYPLNPEHEGTSEQVLGEAMAAGIPCVCLNNPVESHIMLDEYTGFLCSSIEEMADKINLLSTKKNYFDIEKIKTYAKNIYSVEKKIKNWKIIFSEVMKKNKTPKKWKGEEHPFLESMGEYKSILRDGKPDEIKALFQSNRLWYSENKGSVRQYLRYYPGNKLLQKLEKLL